MIYVIEHVLFCHLNMALYAFYMYVSVIYSIMLFFYVQVLQRPWYNGCRRLSLFLSMPDEIDTYQLLTASLESGKECFIPHYIGDRMKMVRLYSLEDYNSLPFTKWKIKQPADNDVRSDIIDTGLN